MPNITRWISSGARTHQVGGRGSGGNFAGFANLTAANVGVASNARLLSGLVSAPTPLPGVQRTYNRGEDGYTGGFIWDAQPNEFGINFESIDADLASFLNQNTILTQGEWDILPEGSPLNFRDTMHLFSRRAQSQESDSDNAPGYENLLVMSASGRLEPGNMEFQSAGASTLQAVASPVQKTHMGTTTLVSFGKASIYSERWFSEYPCSILCFIGNAVLTAIPLGFTPISVAKTKAFLWSTGAALTISSVDTTADTATLSAAPASGAIVIVLYETSDL